MQKQDSESYIGIDVGGTSAKFALVSATGLLSGKGTFPTGYHCTLDEFSMRLVYTIEQLCNQSAANEIRGIKLCLPGVVGIDGVVHGGAPNLPCICNESFASFLQSRFDLPVVVLNDAKAAALGEANYGAGREHQSFLFVIYGTGIGGTLILDGHLYVGAHGYAGELGYADASEGHCAEMQFSTIALVQAAAKAIGKETIGGVELFDRLRSGDKELLPVSSLWLEGNARMLANALLLVDVPLIVIGGGISGVGTFLTDALQKRLDEKLPPELSGGCQIVPARLGNDAALLGAVGALVARMRQ